LLEERREDGREEREREAGGMKLLVWIV